MLNKCMFKLYMPTNEENRLEPKLHTHMHIHTHTHVHLAVDIMAIKVARPDTRSRLHRLTNTSCYII